MILQTILTRLVCSGTIGLALKYQRKSMNFLCILYPMDIKFHNQELARFDFRARKKLLASQVRFF
jgi:hypothetical protein